MKKFDWNHPITRKDFVMLKAWTFGIGITMYVLCILIVFWDNIKSWAGKKVEKIKTKLPWCG